MILETKWLTTTGLLYPLANRRRNCCTFVDTIGSRGSMTSWESALADVSILLTRYKQRIAW